MKQNRQRAIKETLKWEGGYTNHPSDPGGPTNWGITIADARKYWKKDATANDVKAMPQQVAVDIYTTKYWKTSYYDCDQLPAGVDLAVFDFGVNSGPSRAKRYLDQSLGGSSTDTATKLCDKRLTFLKGLRTWPVFGKGWERRVKGIKEEALKMTGEKTVVVKSEDAVVVIGGGVGLSIWANLPEYLPYILIGGAILVALYVGIKFYRKVK